MDWSPIQEQQETGDAAVIHITGRENEEWQGEVVINGENHPFESLLQLLQWIDPE